MRVLFISRARNGKISPITHSQGQSLAKFGIELSYYLIDRSGPAAYLLSLIYLLRNRKKFRSIDVIHAHYSLSAYVATMAFLRPLVVSLMGSDVHGRGYIRILNRLMANLFWDVTIVKSQKMKSTLRYDKVEVIPNGVDIEIFKPLDKKESRNKIGFDPEIKIIIFVANPKRYEKNFELARQSIDLYNDQNKDNMVELRIIENIEHHQVPLYINASDLVLLTSRWEGSPNIIKEAMACNIPIVSTDVGDVREIIGDIKGCFVCKPDYKEISSAVKRALKFDRTQGRERIGYLDSREISNSLLNIYKKVIGQ
ncbi:MAG: glycosyltransferase family 4 protein [Bacteroidetes bacterium]|nr:glycosyltransferase family 4 protein [Bacteroidota bacterium]